MMKNVFSRRNRILLRELVITDFKLRYQGSVLGYAWSILKPLFLFAILYVVFAVILDIGKGVPHFPVYLLTGVTLWNFFTETTINGLQSIVNRGDLIRKINFPKYIIVISGTISALINLGFNLAVIIIFIIINGVEMTPRVFLIAPFILELYIFGLGIAFFLAAANVKFRDIGYLWEIFLQAAFYATPIIYPLQLVIAKSVIAAKIIMLNPVAQSIQDVRYMLVTKNTITTESMFYDWKVVLPYISILFVCILATYYFRNSSKNFAEEI